MKFLCQLLPHFRSAIHPMDSFTVVGVRAVFARPRPLRGAGVGLLSRGAFQ